MRLERNHFPFSRGWNNGPPDGRNRADEGGNKLQRKALLPLAIAIAVAAAVPSQARAPAAPRGGGATSAALLQPAPDGRRQAASPAPAPDANVFLIRENAQPTLWATTVSIDGVKAATLGQKSFTALTLPPGVHAFKLKWPLLSGQRGDAFNLQVVEGQIYYLVVKGISDFAGLDPRGVRIAIGSSMVQLEADAGRALVSTCCQFRRPRANNFRAASQPQRQD